MTQPPPDSVIQTQALSKRYGDLQAVEAVDLTLHRGETLGFVGPNGAGKSTFMKMLIGVVRPSRGGGRLLGRDIVTESTAVRAAVGYLPGDVGLYRNMKGQEFLDYMLAFHPAPDLPKAQRLAQRLEVPLHRMIKTYSSGMRQKLAIIQALAAGAPVLLLDEPTRGLDPTMQTEFLDLLREERDGGASILLSSHILGEVERACDRIVFIDRGRLVEQARIDAARESFRRRLRVSFHHDVSDALDAIEGVEVLSREPPEVLLHLTGELGPALAALAELGLESIDYNRPSLSEIYRALYLEVEAEAPR